MRVTCFVVAISVAAPVSAPAQAPDTGRFEPGNSVFSVQPLFEGRTGPRFEVERALASRLSLVGGGRLTMSGADFIERFPSFSGFDLGLRYYAAGRTFRGPFAGVYAGYDRTLNGVDPERPYQTARFFLGGTAGYDFVFRRRLIIGPSVGAEYGRPSVSTVVKTWEVHPRLGIGFTFE